MADEITQPIPEPAPTDTEGDKDWQQEADKWRAMSRKHEATAKQNADAAKRLAEMEEAQKTAEQKAADKAALSDRIAAQAQQELARLRVAMRKGLTEAQAKRLIGETEEDLEADADELLASFARNETLPEPEPQPPTRPKEKLKSGSTGSDGTGLSQLTREDIKGWSPEDIEAARLAGRLNKILGIVK